MKQAPEDTEITLAQLDDRPISNIQASAARGARCAGQKTPDARL